jgi:hypothetical protein
MPKAIARSEEGGRCGYARCYYTKEIWEEGEGSEKNL